MQWNVRKPSRVPGLVTAFFFLSLLGAISLLGNQIGTSDTSGRASALEPVQSMSNSSTNVPNWSSLRGVDYMWTTVDDPNLTLNTRETGPTPAFSFPQFKANGWNFIRMNMYWTYYLTDPSLYVSNMQTVAWDAEKYGIYIMWNLNQGTGSMQDFPTYITSPYSNNNTSFWTAWWANQTSYGGQSVWSLNLQYDQAIVKAVDNYSSTLGYEIMNEPPIYSSNGLLTGSYNFAGIQQYYNYVANGIREYSSKIVFFMMPYTKPWILTTCMPSCISYPDISNIAFDIHEYDNSYPYLLSQYVSFARSIDAPIVVGEWGPCSGNASSCEATYPSEASVSSFIQTYVSAFASCGCASAYLRWNAGSPGAFGSWQNLLNGTGTDNGGNGVSSQWWLDSEIVSVQGQVYNSTSSSSTSTVTSTVTTTSPSTTAPSGSTTVTSRTTQTSTVTNFLGIDQKKATAITYGSSTSVAILGIGLLGIFKRIRKRQVPINGSWRW